MVLRPPTSCKFWWGIGLEKRREDMEHKQSQIEELSHRVQRIQTEALAFVLAVLGGLGLFIMTAWLLIKGGLNVGATLQLLGQYFPGYSVTWTGAFVGMVYGALLGGVVGWLIGIIYNRIVDLRNRSSHNV
jgi:hypothetical protein